MAVAIIDGARTAFTKIGTTYRKQNAIQLGTKAVNTLVERYNLGQDTQGLLVFGTVIQHADVSNIAREVALESKLHPMTRTFSTILACATSLSSVLEAGAWIEHGNVPWVLAGGTESMSNFPVSFSKQVAATLRDLQFTKTALQKLQAVASLRPTDVLPKIPGVTERLTGLSMGEHCELMVKEWHIPREEQDRWATMSHHRAHEYRGWHEKFIIDGTDNLIRGDTTEEKMAKLKPAFRKDGTLTAANSSPLTDGASAVLLADESYARKKGWPILALLDDAELAAVDIKTEGLLMAPPYAILRLLERQNKKLSDFDTVEIHEAFAGQVLCNLAALTNNTWSTSRVGLSPTTLPDRSRLNPKGGSVAIGHPFAATGARLVMQMAKTMHEEKMHSGLISICAAGGLGLVATLKA